MENVRSEAARTNQNVGILELADRPWQLEELQCLVKGDGFDTQIRRKLSEKGLLRIVGGTYLHHGAEPSNLYTYRFAA